MASDIVNALVGYNPQAFALKNQGLAAQNDQTRANTDYTNAATQGEALKNQAAQIQLRDQQILGQAWRDSAGDYNKTLMGGIQAGLSPAGAMKFMGDHVALRKSAADAYKDEQEGQSKAWSNNVAANNATGAALGSLYQMPPEQRAAAAPGIRNYILQMDPSAQLPADLTSDDSLRAEISKRGYFANILKEQQDAATLDNTRARTQETNQQLATQKRAAAGQELSALADPTGKVADTAAYQAWRAAHPEENAPALPDPAYVARRVRGNVDIKDQAKFDIDAKRANAMRNMTPQSVSDRVDSVIKPTTPYLAEQNRVTKAMVLGAIQDGTATPEEVDKIIDGAANRINTMESTVEGAKQKAPVSIAIHNATQAAQNPTADLDKLTYTTGAGRQYINADDLGKNRAARAQAENAGIPVVDKATHEMLSEIDNARTNMDYMLQRIGTKLAKDPTGRLFSAPGNTIEKLAQTDPDLAAMGTFRTAAIQGMRAVAGSKGLRINKAEIEAAQENDIPKMTDTLPVARQKIANMKAFLDNTERAHLVRDRSAVPQQPGQASGGTGTPLPSALSQSDVGKVFYSPKLGRNVKITAVNPSNPQQFKSEVQ